MKSVFVSLVLFVAGGAVAAPVNSKAINAATQELAKSLGYTVTVKGMKVKGATLKDMLLDYCDQQGCGEEPVMNNDTFESEDETSYGSTSMKAALAEAKSYIGLKGGMEPNEEITPAELAKLNAHYVNAVKLYQRTGVQFGYNGSGESACGMIFTTILVIDTAKKVIFELGRGISGPC